MEIKHTPGPWIAEGFQRTIVNAPNGVTLCLYPSPGIQAKLPEVKANARLIAAAPELLQACFAAQQCINDFLEVYKNGGSMLIMDEAVRSLRDDAGKLANAAIKKATML